jgi:hypothetical protein
MTNLEWRERARQVALAEAVDLELPSGMKLRARRPNPMQLAAWGKLPMALAGAAAQTPAQSLSAAEVAEMAGFLRELLVWCCVEPRVSLEPGPKDIHPSEIPEKDWTFIINWGLRVEEARNLESFRGGRADAGAGRDGEDLRAAAEHPDADRGPRAVAGV